MAYDASSSGWLTSAWSDLRQGKDFYVVLTEKSAESVIERAIAAAKKAGGASPVVKMLNDLSHTAVIPDPTVLVGGLAALGSLGAMEASFLVLILFAHFRGYTVEAGFVVPPYTLDITSCTVKISFERKNT